MDKHQTIITHSSEETAQLGTQMGQRVVSGWRTNTSNADHIFCLYGNLGSGKTTFTQGFARGLGITSRLVSPTFLISKRYATAYTHRFLYHLDIYRMESEQSLHGIGISEIFSDIQSCVIVEWAEKLHSLVPTRRVDIRFASCDDGSHTIDIDIHA